MESSQGSVAEVRKVRTYKPLDDLFLLSVIFEMTAVMHRNKPL